MPQLIVSVEGVEVKHVYLVNDRTTLGRKPGNDILLDNLSVSGNHCVFELQGLADVFLKDLGSTNGTLVNNRRVERQRLRDDDVVAIGGFRIRFRSESGDSGYHETKAMMLEPSGQAASSEHASFQVLSGSSAGLTVPVVKAVTTFGKPGVAVIVVSHRRNGYFVAHMEGTQVPAVNGKPLGPNPVMLANDDVVELGGTQMRFQLKG